MLSEIATLPYVYDFRILKGKTASVVNRLDNVLIHFYDSADGANRKALNQLLSPYRKDTRLRHPAMMDPIDDTIQGQGIAFADESRWKGSGGWGTTRAWPIAQAVWALHERGKEVSFETLLPEVERQFIENDIDPDTPQWSYPKEK